MSMIPLHDDDDDDNEDEDEDSTRYILMSSTQGLCGSQTSDSCVSLTAAVRTRLEPPGNKALSRSLCHP